MSAGARRQVKLSVARFGPVAKRGQDDVRCALRSDTPA
jgi:hypothetical protein